MGIHTRLFSGLHGPLLQTTALSHVLEQQTIPYSAKRTNCWTGKLILLCAVLVTALLASTPKGLSDQHQGIFLFGLTVDGLPVTTEDILKEEAAISAPV